MKVCTKCGSEEGCVWTAEGARCTSCFRQATLHAVKTLVSKHRLVSFKSTICVGANPPSVATVALLAALHDCLTYTGDRRASRMSFSVHVLHVRVPTELFGSAEDGEEAMRCLADEYRFSFKSFELTDEVTRGLLDVHDINDREDLTRACVRRVLTRETRRLGCSTLLISASGTEVAIETLSRTVKGRGGSVPEEIRPVTQIGSVRVARPFIELSARHVARYAKLCGVDTWARPSPYVPLPDASIDELTSNFVLQLQSSQPATSSTIVRTARRLEGREDLMTCDLCGSREVVPHDSVRRHWDFGGQEDASLCQACGGVFYRRGSGGRESIFDLQRSIIQEHLLEDDDGDS